MKLERNVAAQYISAHNPLFFTLHHDGAPSPDVPTSDVRHNGQSATSEQATDQEARS